MIALTPPPPQARAPRRAVKLASLCAVALGTGLQACADRPNLPPPDFASETANPIQISRTRVAHAVTFPQGGSEPETAQVAALFAFIAANSVGPKDTVLIEHGDELVDLAHAETVAGRLLSVGLHPSVVASASVSTGIARVVVERYVAIAPACPDWSHKPSPNFQNYDQRNFGCADAANLAAMVADPKDLAMGATMGPQVGDPVTKPISDYRAGTPGGAGANIFGGGATSGGGGGGSGGGGSSGGGGAAPGSSAPSGAGP